jgi:hypothetical protein
MYTHVSKYKNDKRRKKKVNRKKTTKTKSVRPSRMCPAISPFHSQFTSYYSLPQFILQWVISPLAALKPQTLLYLLPHCLHSLISQFLGVFAQCHLLRDSPTSLYLKPKLGLGQVVEHLCSKWEDLSSKPVPQK